MEGLLSRDKITSVPSVCQLVIQITPSHALLIPPHLYHLAPSRHTCLQSRVKERRLHVHDCEFGIKWSLIRRPAIVLIRSLSLLCHRYAELCLSLILFLITGVQ